MASINNVAIFDTRCPISQMILNDFFLDPSDGRSLDLLIVQQQVSKFWNRNSFAYFSYQFSYQMEALLIYSFPAHPTGFKIPLINYVYSRKSYFPICPGMVEFTPIGDF